MFVDINNPVAGAFVYTATGLLQKLVAPLTAWGPPYLGQEWIINQVQIQQTKFWVQAFGGTPDDLFTFTVAHKLILNNHDPIYLAQRQYAVKVPIAPGSFAYLFTVDNIFDIPNPPLHIPEGQQLAYDIDIVPDHNPSGGNLVIETAGTGVGTNNQDPANLNVGIGYTIQPQS